MRISDWSSDVCSSDLIDRRRFFCKSYLLLKEVAWESSGSMQVNGFAACACDWVSPNPSWLRGLAFPIAILASWSMMRSEEHTSELQSLMRISYAVFCLKKKIKHTVQHVTI